MQRGLLTRHAERDEYRLGSVQAGVIRILHKAYPNGDGWVTGVSIRAEIKCKTEHLMELFKGKSRTLIESDERGKYRLRLAPSGAAQLLRTSS